MRSHDFDHDGSGSLRPKSARLDDPETEFAAQAAVAGRWDIVGTKGLLDLQRSAGNQGVAAAVEDAEPSPVHDVVNSGGGQPLDSGVRAEMEARLGHDFGDVRVHHDARAEESAKAVNAHAYTVGSNIVFQRDHYNPSSDEGRVTLAHELTHVIQQRRGPVDGTAAPGGIRVSDPADRFEQEAAANAERVVSVPSPATSMAGNPPGAAPAIQREEDELPEEEPTVQGTFAQRDEDEEARTEQSVGTKSIQRDAPAITMPAMEIFELAPGTTPAQFIQQQIDLMKQSIQLYWDNYSDGLINFQNSMAFSSEQEAESQYLNAALKGGLKADLDIFLDKVIEACPELMPLKVIKEEISSLMEEYERVEKAEAEVKIVDFLDEERNKIGPSKAASMDKYTAQVVPTQRQFAQLAGESGDSVTGSSATGDAALLLKHLQAGQEELRKDVEAKTAPVWQLRITEEFALTGPQLVGPVTAGLHESGTLYLDCHVYKDERGGFSVKDIGSDWDLRTNAAKPDRVASSLDRALKAMGKGPAESSLPKVVNATLEIESGHWYSTNDYDETAYKFTDINDVDYSTGDALLHGNDPIEFREAWDAVVRDKLKSIDKIVGHGS